MTQEEVLSLLKYLTLSCQVFWLNHPSVLDCVGVHQCLSFVSCLAEDRQEEGKETHNDLDWN